MQNHKALNNASINQKVVNSKIRISVSSAVCLFPFSSTDICIITVQNHKLSQARVVLSQFLLKQTFLMNSVDLLSELGPWNCAQYLCFATGFHPLPVVSDKLKAI